MNRVNSGEIYEIRFPSHYAEESGEAFRFAQMTLPASSFRTTGCDLFRDADFFVVHCKFQCEDFATEFCPRNSVIHLLVSQGFKNKDWIDAETDSA